MSETFTWKREAISESLESQGTTKERSEKQDSEEEQGSMMDLISIRQRMLNKYEMFEREDPNL